MTRKTAEQHAEANLRLALKDEMRIRNDLRLAEARTNTWRDMLEDLRAAADLADLA